MATPRGAEHRDLEQRLRNMERSLQSLTGAALRRRQLSVESGDFAVTGGGNVVVRGGRLVSQYPDGTLGFTVGQRFTLAEDGMESCDLFLSADGTEDRLAFQVTRILPGDVYPEGYASLSFAGDSVNMTSNTGMTLRGWKQPGVDRYMVCGSAGFTFWSPVFVRDALTTDGDVDCGGKLYSRDYATTSSAANMFMASGGQIMRVQSSRRYKRDVQDAQVPDDVLDGLVGRTWRDKAEVADDPETTRRYVGYIAEELHEAGLGEYVMYDDEGRPDGIAYDRLTVPLAEVLRRHRDELATAKAERDELREQIAALSERLTTLENA